MYKKTYIHNLLVSENEFIKQQIDHTSLPKFEEVKGYLPQPFWDNHEEGLGNSF